MAQPLFIRIFFLAFVLAGMTASAVSVPAVLAQNDRPVPDSRSFGKTGRSGLVPCGNYAGDPCSVEDVFNIIVIVTNYLIGLAGIIAIASIVYAGFSMVAAAGNSSGIETAKKRLTNSLLGLTLILLAFVLINAIFSATLGIGVLRDKLLLTQPEQYICTDKVNCK